MEAKHPARPGAMIQARKTWTTPELMAPVPLPDPTHWTPETRLASRGAISKDWVHLPLAPTEATPMPMTPPRMEWVVETGIPTLVAKVR